MKGRGGRGPVKGAPERLAVQGHHALTALGEAAHEGHKTRLELGRIEQPKHAREGVMAWDAVPEREDLSEEGVLGAPEPDHVGAGLAPAQHGAQANEQDLQKLVALGIARARILQIRENRRKLLHGTTFDPKWCHRVEPVRLNSQANFLKCDSPVSPRLFDTTRVDNSKGPRWYGRPLRSRPLLGAVRRWCLFYLRCTGMSNPVWLGGVDGFD